MQKNNSQNQNWFDKNLKQEAIYKISLPEEYNQNDELNTIQASKLDIESGFIHTSFGHQVKETVEKFFQNKEKMLLIELNKDMLSHASFTLKVEKNRPDGAAYPHLYPVGFLPKKAIHTVLEFNN